MKTVITYISNDAVSVKTAFDQLMVARSGNKTQVLIDLKQNTIAVANADQWESELNQIIEIAKPWIVDEPLLVGWLRMYSGQTYLCIQAHTTQINWTPNLVPALFTLKPIPQTGQLYPDWIQPTGAQDAYNTGDRVHYVPNDTNYESLIDSNVWSPLDYPQGWTII